MNVAIIDIETGGFSISKNGVCEIAVMAFTPTFEVLEEYQSYIKPYQRELGSDELVSYKEDSMAVNGITMDQLENGNDVDCVIIEFFQFLERNKVSTIIAHNKAFDIPRLNYLGKRFAAMDLDHLEQLCTLELSKCHAHGLANHKLETMCKYFGIVNEQAHSALGDVKATFELYKKLLGF